MSIHIVSFTRRGYALSIKLNFLFSQKQIESSVYAMPKYTGHSQVLPVENLSNWCGELFKGKEAMVFIGACGIAVRTIAPFIRDKAQDPPVIVVDELGRYVIPILSGHLGGANALAMQIADLIEGEAVITTATDINHKFAVDLFAKANSLYIQDMSIAKKISSVVLEDKKIGFFCDYAVEGELPKNFSNDKGEVLGICISADGGKKPFATTLNLIPSIYSIGFGCRKGKSLEEIEEQVLKVLEGNHISLHAIRNVASIELKREEKGLLKFCEKYNFPLKFYSSELLGRARGRFEGSDFVKQTTGVNNVCERSAVIASNNGELVVKKYVNNGITLAIAKKEWCINFE